MISDFDITPDINITDSYICIVTIGTMDMECNEMFFPLTLHHTHTHAHAHTLAHTHTQMLDKAAQ